MVIIEGLEENIDKVRGALKRIKVSVSDSQIEQLRVYLQELTAYNEHTNLISSTQSEILIDRHVLDSCSILEFQDLFGTSDNMVDLGSGAGFPGVVLPIVRNNLKVSLVDSNKKKAAFLTSVVNKLGLADRVTVFCERAEELGHNPQFRGKYDLVTARALGHLVLNAELGLPLIKISGKAIFWKTLMQTKEEIKELEKMLESLGARDFEVVRPQLKCGSVEHVLVKIVKTREGSNTYPRKWKTIKKQLDALKKQKS